jgi:NAD(P)-dependent dehydrogenase (short-subunit alcohol dehydrogenase family)
MAIQNTLKGKTILITGATDGIGKETAKQLAEMGGHLLIHGRNLEKCEKAKAEIIQFTGNEALEIFVADFQSMENVRDLAQEMHARVDQLDILINNAGIFTKEFVRTPDGFELTFAVNHLAHFLLTNLLLDLLKQSSPARVIIVSSSSHTNAKVDLNNLNAEKKFSAWNAYCLSKLGNLLFAFALARRLKGTGITVNALHPGAINTKMLRFAGGIQGQPVEEGAETPVFLASAPEVANITGKYFIGKEIAQPSGKARDQDLQKRFWEMSEKMVGL